MVPANRAEGTGTKPDAGTHAASTQSDAQAVLIVSFVV